jgi:ubiquitin-conjugating enzyme E2 variant
MFEFTIQVDPSKFPTLGHWKNSFTIEIILTELKKDMVTPANKKLPQPAEGSNF